MKIVTVVGTRPQFVKAAVVSKAIAARPELQEQLVHTGQHYDETMSQIFFDQLGLESPWRNLGVGSGSHARQTGAMLVQIEHVLLEEKPDVVLVFGDTNSTLAGALAAVKLHICVAHVEAGLRSFNRRMPEEINRIVTDHVSELLFAPTKAAVENLRREGFSDERIRLVGDVMYDAAMEFGEKADKNHAEIQKLRLLPNDYVLATVHRAENTNDPIRLKTIFDALCDLSSDVRVVIPLHPRTRQALEQGVLLEKVCSMLDVIEPQGYLGMAYLLKNSSVIATDSGGIQKEAFFYRVPCVTLRDETEWTETVQLGANRLVGADPTLITEAVRDGLSSDITLPDPGPWYGEGRAAVLIAEELEKVTLK